MVTLDIFSDPICPWCYIGKSYLDRALQDAPDHPFTIRWRPFMLNPDMPAEGMDRRAYLETKFGGKDGAVKAYMPVFEHARDAGLTINLDAIERTPSTLDAHRLIHWAGIEGVQTAVVSALFTAYFVESRDIGNREVLGDIADACGLDAPSFLPGSPADFIVFKARNWTELFSRPQTDRIVVRGGEMIDTTLPDYAELDHLMEG